MIPSPEAPPLEADYVRFLNGLAELRGITVEDLRLEIKMSKIAPPRRPGGTGRKVIKVPMRKAAGRKPPSP